MSGFIPESSSNESVVKIVDGQIIAVGGGSATITGHLDTGDPYEVVSTVT